MYKRQQVCTEAERAFLSAMGGGCQTPVAAHAVIQNDIIHMPGVSFGDGTSFSESKVKGNLTKALELGKELAEKVKDGL